MEFANLKGRAILWGHLVVTLPAIAAIPLVFLFCNYLYVSVSVYFVYYVTAGAAIGYQWYAAAMPRWRMALRRKGLSESEIEAIARQGGLALPGASAVGIFALQTSAAALCATYLNLWLAGRIVHWVLPLIGASAPHNAIYFYMQHFELANAIPAFVLGYIISRKFPEFGSWAWLLPTLVILHKLITYAEPNVSVFAVSHPWHRFSYYFVIARPRFNFLPSGLDRLFEQIRVVAPFYSSLAYSVGAVAMKTNALQRVRESFPNVPDAEIIQPGIVDTPNDFVEEPLQRK
jgi:hypothetical protein